MKIDIHIEKSSFFVAAWTFFLDSGRPWKKIINKPEIFVIHVMRNLSEQQVEIFKGIVDVHDLCDHVVCFLGDRSSGGILPDRFYEFCKRSSCMDPASCDFKITAFPCKFMIDLVSIRDHSPGESIQEFTRMV